MIDFVKKYKWLLIILLIILLVGVPVIIGFIYAGIGDPIPSGDLLSYYGAALSFIGTALLSCLALYQTNLIQKKEEEKEELLKKQEIERNQPKFRIKKVNSDSKMSLIDCNIINISDNVAYNVSIKDMNIYKDNAVAGSIESIFSKSAVLPAEAYDFTLNILGDCSGFDGIRATMTYKDKYETEHDMLIIGKRIEDVLNFEIVNSINV